MREFLVTVAALSMFATAACGPDRVDPKVERAVVMDRLGDGAILLQELRGISEFDSNYIVCMPDGTMALVRAFSSHESVTVDPPLIFEKGSRPLTGKPVEEVRCILPRPVAQTMPSPDAIPPIPGAGF